MKALFQPVIIVAAGILALGVLPSCSEKAKQERAAENAAETSVDIMEDYCEVLESMKDKESAGKAIASMDGIAEKFGKLAEQAKKAGNTEPDAATKAKIEEKMKALSERMQKASLAAAPILASDPALAKALADKQMLIASKMAEATK